MNHLNKGRFAACTIDSRLIGSIAVAFFLFLLSAGNTVIAYAADIDADDIDLAANISNSAALGNFVWLDQNGDGLQNEEELTAGVPGIRVQLYRQDRSPQGVTFITSTSTSADGHYRFNNLPAGSYYVQFVVPAEYAVTLAQQGNDDALDSDADASTLLRTPLTRVADGEENLTLDLGLTLDAAPASIGDRVWQDANMNGLQDAGESGASGVIVQLYAAEGKFIASLTSAADGSFLFRNLPYDSYYLKFQPPTDWTLTLKAQGASALQDSNADPQSGLTESFLLQAGEENQSIDAGVYEDAAINGREGGANGEHRVLLPLISR